MDEWLVVDIGGTKLAAAAYDGRELRAFGKTPTLAQEGPQRVIARLFRLLSDTAERAGLRSVRGIGIACPGPLSAKQGIVWKAPTMGWENVPLASLVSERFSCPVLLENDANAAALGEAVFGAGRGAANVAYITVSTGVGCGLVLDGKIWEGAHEAAGELGHLVIHPQGKKCACGRRGCLERYASGTAVGEQAAAIWQREHPGAAPITAKEAADLAREGNAAMARLFRQAGESLGRGIAAIQQLIDVDRVVIGGSMANALDLMRAAIVRTVQKQSYWGADPDAWLRRAELGGDSGLYGAAALISGMGQKA